MNISIGKVTWRNVAVFFVAGYFVLVNGCALFEDERSAKGRKLYNHYCSHCHGESGRQNEGFNWSSMPDPRPRDLSDKSAMSTFSDEEIFNTIYRDMKDTTPEVGDKIGDEEFAVPTMPTFKFTLSEDEIWSIVGHVRSLHGMSLEYDLEGRRKQLEEELKLAEEALNQAKQTLAVAEQKVAEQEAAARKAFEAAGNDPDDFEPEEVELAEEELVADADEKYEQAKQALENFSKRPKRSQVSRPDLTVTPEERAKLEKLGKQLYENKYGCNACHSINGQGGIVGPKLDRAGFRLNDTWIYRWILYPQGMKKHTRMPNLGITADDGKAITIYLKTLRAPKPDKPIPLPE